MFLMVENSGEADVRAFTKLGLSSARDKSDKIGQFGSGAKHGVLVLMREGLNPHIYCGRTKIEFFTQPNMMGDTTYNDMFVRIGNKTHELSFCLEFGAIDWNDVDMGLREIVSNAIDNSDSVQDVSIRIVEKPRAKAGCTRVFIPMNSQVQKFVNTLSERFLQFGEHRDKTIIPKTTPGKTKVYRKGVLVHEFDKYNPDGLYDYNFGEELNIDECRNSNEWDCKRAIGRAVCQDESVVRTMFERFIKNNNGQREYLEDRLSEYDITSRDWWNDLWNKVSNNAVILSPDQSMMRQFLDKKKTHYYVVPSKWYSAMAKGGIQKATLTLDTMENKGYTVVKPTPQMKDMLNEVWSLLVDLELINHKEKPEIKGFSKAIENNEGTLFGFYEKGVVFINVDFSENRQTYLEELCHHITQAADGTREFQEFAFQVATRAAEIIYT